ncbi:hypothetical protein E2R51_02160 [Jeotgalibacillus sp. S-D1]|uniref:endolytic transglycosylase MltG n=1 Tax=Jeotgalibacillus sp. S-D1 TaxID=2552189 RepID=UPI00105932F9|nr:endolytic transglycosylase MltG [Jeotgalibacillus sp. S-D1]TDL34541.1 hypothetical protein E2R51_02160 [Jeotgalibacillus sp. S-D1]
MDKRTFRALGAGIITGALIMFAFTYFTAQNDEATASEPKETEGTIILTQEEFDSLNTQLKEWENRAIELSKSQNTATDNTESETASMTRFILSVESGMTFPEISEKLAEYDIIPSSEAFNDYLMDNQLTDQIQIGTYDLHSSLSIEEIASILTK